MLIIEDVNYSCTKPYDKIKIIAIRNNFLDHNKKWHIDKLSLIYGYILQDDSENNLQTLCINYNHNKIHHVVLHNTKEGHKKKFHQCPVLGEGLKVQPICIPYFKLVTPMRFPSATKKTTVLFIT